MGFTLVELIVVIAMIGILSAIAFATLDPIGQMQKGWDAQRKSDLVQIQRALEMFYQDTGVYPRASPGNASNPGAYQIRDIRDVVVPWGNDFSPYMTRLPKDQNRSKKYVYLTNTTKQSYWLYASLDRGGKDSQACKQDGSKCDSAPPDSNGIRACGDVCNYGVSSANVSP